MSTKTILNLAAIGLATVSMAIPSAAQSSAFLQGNAQGNAKTMTITGRVSCSSPVGPLGGNKAMSAAQAIQFCANQGTNYYTLVSGERTFKLNGDRKQLAKLAGKTITVAGVLSPASSDVATYSPVDTFQVTSFVSAKE